MKILVTGANGFLGSHIVEHFAKRGHEVSCLVRATSDCKWIAGLNVRCLTGDINQPLTLEDAIKNVDVVIHSAAILRARATKEYFDVNQIGTRNIINAVLHSNPALKYFILISSQAAMGPSPEFRPKSTTEANTPVSDYGRSKLAGEGEVINGLKGLVPYTIFRPASVYGPRDKDIFIFFRMVKNGIAPRTIERRYLQLCFAGDIPVAVERALTMPIARDKIYCLGEPAWYTWPQIGSAIAEANQLKTFSIPLPDWIFGMASSFAEMIAGISGKPAVLNRQKINEMRRPYWITDVNPAISELAMGFTNLSRGAKITYQWYRENNWL